jgi:hypothetical protein
MPILDELTLQLIQENSSAIGEGRRPPPGELFDDDDLFKSIIALYRETSRLAEPHHGCSDEVCYDRLFREVLKEIVDYTVGPELLQAMTDEICEKTGIELDAETIQWIKKAAFRPSYVSLEPLCIARWKQEHHEAPVEENEYQPPKTRRSRHVHGHVKRHHKEQKLRDKKRRIQIGDAFQAVVLPFVPGKKIESLQSPQPVRVSGDELLAAEKRTDLNGGWTAEEKLLFNRVFRRSLARSGPWPQLKVISNELAHVKTNKQVVEYWFRQKVPEYLRLLQNKKREVASRIVECIDKRRCYDFRKEVTTSL